MRLASSSFSKATASVTSNRMTILLVCSWSRWCRWAPRLHSYRPYTVAALAMQLACNYHAIRKRDLSNPQAGDHFGELSLLEPGANPRASVFAGPGTRVGIVGLREFNEVCEIEPGFRTALMNSSQKYQHFNFFATLPLLKMATVELVQAWSASSASTC